MQSDRRWWTDLWVLWLQPALTALVLIAGVVAGTLWAAAALMQDAPPDLADVVVLPWNLPDGQCPRDDGREEQRLAAELATLVAVPVEQVVTLNDCDDGFELSAGLDTDDPVEVGRWRHELADHGWRPTTLDEMDAHPSTEAWAAPGDELAVTIVVVRDGSGRVGPSYQLDLFVPGLLG